MSTADQSCARQERDLAAIAERAGYEVVGTYKETASGVKLDRTERRKVLTLVAGGRSYRLVGHKVGLSKNTVAEIVKRGRNLGGNGMGKLCNPPMASTAEVDGELLVR